MLRIEHDDKFVPVPGDTGQKVIPFPLQHGRLVFYLALGELVNALHAVDLQGKPRALVGNNDIAARLVLADKTQPGAQVDSRHGCAAQVKNA